MIHIVNGPNLNLLGTREPELYGTMSLKELKRQLEDIAFCNNEEISFLQSNHEGEIIDYLQACKPDDFIILNPGGLGHSSVCLRDCVRAIAAETIEVHISNIYARESFRQRSLLSSVCSGTISGFGIDCYKMALNWYLERE